MKGEVVRPQYGVSYANSHTAMYMCFMATSFSILWVLSFLYTLFFLQLITNIFICLFFYVFLNYKIILIRIVYMFLQCIQNRQLFYQCNLEETFIGGFSSAPIWTNFLLSNLVWSCHLWSSSMLSWNSFSLFLLYWISHFFIHVFLLGLLSHFSR